MPAIYADHAWQGPVVVEENIAIARDTYRLRLACPEIARRALPGQFVMLRLMGANDPLLGRPLAFYDITSDSDGNPHSIDLVYLTIGKMTRLLPDVRAGALMEVFGPLGNGFPSIPTKHLLMVAGGIGQTPFLMLAKEYLGLQSYGDPPRSTPRSQRATLCYGVRNREFLAGDEDLRQARVTVHVSTDDGSTGHHGLVTELIADAARQSSATCRIVCCGPEPMLKATADIAARLGLECQVSLESPMACGIGICFSCVKKIRDGSGQWDYRRTCVEGPVFDAADVEF
jgi:dihydroorotate dehydrogenase electron transfer subunit